MSRGSTASCWFVNFSLDIVLFYQLLPTKANDGIGHEKAWKQSCIWVGTQLCFGTFLLAFNIWWIFRSFHFISPLNISIWKIYTDVSIPYLWGQFYISQSILKLTVHMRMTEFQILLPPSAKCWDCGCLTPLPPSYNILLFTLEVRNLWRAPFTLPNLTSFT